MYVIVSVEDGRLRLLSDSNETCHNSLVSQSESLRAQFGHVSELVAELFGGVSYTDDKAPLGVSAQWPFPRLISTNLGS